MACYERNELKAAFSSNYFPRKASVAGAPKTYPVYERHCNIHGVQDERRELNVLEGKPGLEEFGKNAVLCIELRVPCIAEQPRGPMPLIGPNA